MWQLRHTVNNTQRSAARAKRRKARAETRVAEENVAPDATIGPGALVVGVQKHIATEYDGLVAHIAVKLVAFDRQSVDNKAVAENRPHMWVAHHDAVCRRRKQGPAGLIGPLGVSNHDGRKLPVALCDHRANVRRWGEVHLVQGIGHALLLKYWQVLLHTNYVEKQLGFW